MWAHWRHLANIIERVLLQPTRVHIPNGTSIGSAVFAVTSVTDRQTDRPRYSVGNNRPHLRTV